MKQRASIAALAGLLVAAVLLAQTPTQMPTFISFAGMPTGTCGDGTLARDSTTQNLYGCDAGRTPFQ